METKIGQIQTDLQNFSRRTPPNTGVSNFRGEVIPSKSSQKTMMVLPRESRPSLTESSLKIAADLDFLKTQVRNLQKVLESLAASAKDESSKQETENKILNGLKERFKQRKFISINQIRVYFLIIFCNKVERNWYEK